MAHITGGEVTYLRRVKTGDYEHKELAVKLSFSLDDNEDYESAFEGVMWAAVSRSHNMLGLKSDIHVPPPKKSKPIPTPVADLEVDEEDEEEVLPEVKPEPIKAKRGRPSKPKPMPVPADPDEGLEVQTDIEDVIAAKPVPAKPVAREISASDAQKATVAAASKHGPVAVRKALQKYAPRAGEIPADQRQAYLDDLAALG